MVESGSRNYRIPFNTPLSIVYADPKFVEDRSAIVGRKDLIACRQAPKVSENVIYVRDPLDLESTFNYLTGHGGGSVARQSDCFGIVPFDPDNALSRNFDELSLVDDLMSDDPAKVEAAKNNLIASRIAAVKKHRATVTGLKKQSETRILSHLRHKHNNLIAQWKRNEEMKMGKYPPSLSERLGYFVLDKEIKARESAASESTRLGNEMMNAQAI